MNLKEQISRIKRIILLSESSLGNPWDDEEDEEKDDDYVDNTDEYEFDFRNSIIEHLDTFYNEEVPSGKYGEIMGKLLFHGTDVHPSEFQLRHDFSRKRGRGDKRHFPTGYFFLTPDLNLAEEYGRYIIPFEVRNYENNLTFQVERSPAYEFSFDYEVYSGIREHMSFKYHGYWEKFLESRKPHLVLTTGNTTIMISNVNYIFERTDLAEIFYEKYLKK